MKEDERIEKYCKYCESARALTEEDTMLCVRAGVVDASFSCRKFRYDPLKRTPHRPTKQMENLEKLEFVDI